jgi:hypothetical protein
MCHFERAEKARRQARQRIGHDRTPWSANGPPARVPQQTEVSAAAKLAIAWHEKREVAFSPPHRIIQLRIRREYRSRLRYPPRMSSMPRRHRRMVRSR